MIPYEKPRINANINEVNAYLYRLVEQMEQHEEELQRLIDELKKEKN